MSSAKRISRKIAVAHALLLGPEGEIVVEAPDGGQVEALERGVGVVGGRAHEVTPRRELDDILGALGQWKSVYAGPVCGSALRRLPREA